MSTAAATDALPGPPPCGAAGTPGRPARRRAPLAAMVAAGTCFLEALVLLTLGLSGLGSQLSMPGALPGAVVAVLLGGLSAWVVLTAVGGATLVDGAGRRLLQVVAGGELVLVAAVVGLGLLTPGDVPTVDAGPWRSLPVPALAVLAAAVPCAKLLLAGTPVVTGWVASGGSPTRRAPRTAAPLPPRQRRVQVATLAVIGLALIALALVVPPAGSLPDPAATNPASGSGASHGDVAH